MHPCTHASHHLTTGSLVETTGFSGSMATMGCTTDPINLLGGVVGAGGPDAIACPLVGGAGQPAVVATDSRGSTALCWAAQDGDASAVADLLAQGADPADPDEAGRTPLMHACHGGHLSAVSALLASGHAAVAAQTGRGVTALSRAAAGGHLAVVQALLLASAPVDQRDGAGNTALFHAAARGHVAVAEMLLHAGASRVVVNHNGQTPAEAARRRGQWDTERVVAAQDCGSGDASPRAGKDAGPRADGEDGIPNGGDGKPSRFANNTQDGGTTLDDDTTTVGRGARLRRGMIRKCFVHPCGALLLLLMVFGLPAAFLALFVVKGDVTIDISLQSFTAPNHPTSLRHDALAFLTGHCQGYMGEDCLHCNAADGVDGQGRRRGPGSVSVQPQGDADQAAAGRRRQTAWTLTIVYEADEGTMMTPAKVAVMQQVEQRMLAKAQSRSRHRWGATTLVRSLLQYLYPGNAWTVADAPPPTQEQIEERMRYAASTIPVAGYPDPLGENVYTRAGNDMTPTHLESRTIVAQIYVPGTVNTQLICDG